MNTVIAPGLYAGTVMHHRLAAPVHRFCYPLSMWLIDPADPGGLARRVHGFGHNARSPVAFWNEDHFAGTDDAPLDQLRAVLASGGRCWPGGPVRLLTHCRVLGYVFNPVSFWYCYSPDGVLDAVVAEVNNTYGERHCYVSPVVDQGRPRPTASHGLHWRDKKVFHVSPFLSLEGSYAFAIESPSDHLRARIDLRRGDEPCLVTVLDLDRKPLTRWSVARLLVDYPLSTLKVTGAIHFEAFRLWRKGASYHVKPPYDPDRSREGTM